MFVKTAETPNPNVNKFIFGFDINPGDPISISSAEEATKMYTWPSSLICKTLLPPKGIFIKEQNNPHNNHVLKCRRLVVKII